VADAASLERQQVARSGSDRALLGVCGGIAAALGIDAVLVRLIFILAAALGGAGVAVYAAAAIALPRSAERRPARGDVLQTATATTILVGAELLLVDRVGLLLPLGLLWPAAAILGGIGIAVRIGGGVPAPGRRPRWARPATVEVLRAVGALVLIGGAGAALVAQSGGLTSAALIAVTAALAAAGVALLVGPRLARARLEAGAERAERARAEERVAVAARLHDSVLQTLALIQRSDDAGRSQRLARQQERELRSWLYGGSATNGATTLSGALVDAAVQVEERYGVVVDLVQPSDAALDDRLAELVAAAAEAMTNSGKHAGVEQVSVLARVTTDEVSIFVRDRGRGFDMVAVAGDRRGLADSIRGRMERVGGTARIWSAAGEGTEVELVLPRNGS
jgi:signal transduction histidine kinase